MSLEERVNVLEIRLDLIEHPRLKAVMVEAMELPKEKIEVLTSWLEMKNKQHKYHELKKLLGE